MQKYIVEVDTPKKGQVVGTGGIRENGKMAVLFKNPRPYVEPQTPKTSQISRPRYSTHQNGLTRQIQSNILPMLWSDLAEPLLHYGLNKLATKAITAIESRHETHLNSVNDKNIVDGDFREISSDDNIVRFPNSKVI